MLTIGVRYCGGWYPQIDRSRIVWELREGFQKIGREVNFTSEKERPVDLVLMINGCRHACLEAKNLKAGRGRREISVKGEMINDQYVEENDIPKLLIPRIGSSLTPEMTSQSPFDKRGGGEIFMVRGDRPRHED